MLHLMGSVMVWSLCFVIAFCTCGGAIAHLSVFCFLFFGMILHEHKASEDHPLAQHRQVP